MLSKAHDSITRLEQTEREDEGQFSERISKAAWICRHVFTRDDLVNYHVHELKTAVHKMVAHKFRQCLMPNREIFEPSEKLRLQPEDFIPRCCPTWEIMTRIR